MQPNLKSKSLEQLEKNIWPSLSSDETSYLIKICHNLRKKPLIDFSVEDTRIMIGQNIGLEYLIPMAIDFLQETILAEGDYYEGDLLTSVLSSDSEYWKTHSTEQKLVITLFETNQTILQNCDATWEIKKQWTTLFRDFQNL
jgi:hypothetical protein